MRRWILLTFSILLSGSAVASMTMIVDRESSYQSSNREWRLHLSKSIGRSSLKRATLHRNGTNRAPARWTLVNWPNRVFVANDGTVATVNASGAYADVVIYRSNGSLVRRLKTSDVLIPDDIKAIEVSTGGVALWWEVTHRIDEEKRQVVLQVKGPPKRLVEIPISLDNGRVLAPVRRHFWLTAYQRDVTYRAASELLDRLSQAVIPKYSEVGVKARIEGTVVLQVSVDEDGIVDDVKVVKPLPFGLDQSAVAAIRQWRFRPSMTRTEGQLSVSFALREVPPPLLE
jgi:TonB family protein